MTLLTSVYCGAAALGVLTAFLARHNGASRRAAAVIGSRLAAVIAIVVGPPVATSVSFAAALWATLASFILAIAGLVSTRLWTAPTASTSAETTDGPASDEAGPSMAGY